MKLIWSSISRSLRSALMVVKGKVLNDFPRFVGILIVEFAADGAVNLKLEMKRDMIIKKFRFEANELNAKVRDFSSKSLKRVLSLLREILHDVVGTSRYHCRVFRSFSVEGIEQGNK
ncbi:hypothetical protein Tco_0728403 [Tanacetum coccineum]|uniref:Uncharacterized protein n=1 Tax=Tanacetum coccineum TaxID=301880 RepID=A0ABQ4YNP7_9ASTR